MECPTCGSPEMHPDGDKLLIRVYKVYQDGLEWSQCLVCAGYYDKDLNVIDEAARPTGGWYAEE
ncbi:hypothetical protein LCGC14_2100970 [marine sediment metagenome]|uniref:Transcription factor zinc-finger domain-containing protein n=1 Tax=marine sediment metagenome TaxID=412755 RepID=A0A0F9EA43_9ZZZZ